MLKRIRINGELKRVFKSKIPTYGCCTYFVDFEGDLMTTQRSRKGCHSYRDEEAMKYMYDRDIVKKRRYKNKA